MKARIEQLIKISPVPDFVVSILGYIRAQYSGICKCMSFLFQRHDFDSIIRKMYTWRNAKTDNSPATAKSIGYQFPAHLANDVT